MSNTKHIYKSGYIILLINPTGGFLEYLEIPNIKSTSIPRLQGP